jgi:hypothetical protein
MKEQSDSVKVVAFWNFTPRCLTFQFPKFRGFNSPPQRARFLTDLQQKNELSKLSKKITLMAHVSNAV